MFRNPLILEFYFGHFSAEPFVCCFERFKESAPLHFFDMAVEEQGIDHVLAVLGIFVSDNLLGGRFDFR